MPQLLSHFGYRLHKDFIEFKVITADGKSVAAETEIDGKTVVVRAGGVTPVAVQFGWNKTVQPNLVNGAGLPAAPFHSDEWQGGTGKKGGGLKAEGSDRRTKRSTGTSPVGAEAVRGAALELADLAHHRGKPGGGGGGGGGAVLELTDRARHRGEPGWAVMLRGAVLELTDQARHRGEPGGGGGGSQWSVS